MSCHSMSAEIIYSAGPASVLHVTAPVSPRSDLGVVTAENRYTRYVELWQLLSRDDRGGVPRQVCLLHHRELPDSLSSDPKFLNLVDTLTRDKVDEFLPVRCPDAAIMKRIEDMITELRDQHDSIGGTVTYIIRGYPSGLGEPCFNKPKALLAHAYPPATISQDQTTARYDASGEGVLAAKGRHDPNVVPRVVPIVEAMAALTIADALMAQHARQMGMKIAAARR
ncbi:chorismate synthase [Cordyceps militaris CM01]|uniref:chorismate synthase n=1 Tax=Cordyceps militaris (strain CM01) TaxID=983644 RepID=G3JCN9_CORMM|nr:chorismate synthase [Cordyceps militaris CM01]EGX93851.1 chorismate synthase [Cordyceps militaris CM01]